MGRRVDPCMKGGADILQERLEASTGSKFLSEDCGVGEDYERLGEV